MSDTVSPVQSFDPVAHAISSVGIGLWSLDLGSSQLTWDSTTEALFGFAPGEFNGALQTAMDRILPEDIPALYTEAEAAIAQRRTYRVEYRVRLPSGQVRWIENTGTAIESPGGGVRRMHGITRDITAQKDSEQRFRQLADLLPQIVWITGLDGEVLYTNQRWHEYTGIPEHEVSIEAWRRVVHPDDLERVVSAQSESLEHKTPFEIEYRVRRFDGEFRWFLARTIFVDSSLGQPAQRFGTATDIHERKLAQAKEKLLSQTSEILATALNPVDRLERAARLLSEYFDGGCAIYNQQKDGRIALAAAAHSDPGHEELIRRIDREFPYRPTDSYGPSRAIREGKSSLTCDVRPEQLEMVISDPEHLKMLLEFGIRSSLVVPLGTDRGRFGALIVITSKRNYDPEDLETLEEVSRRAAWAVDNARLYREQEETLTLMRAFLRAAPVGMSFLDRELKYVHINDELARINGVPIEMTIGRSMQEVIPKIAPTVAPMIQRVLSGADPFTREIEVQDGRSFRVSYYPVRSSQAANSTILGAGATVVDITQQKEARQRLEAAVRSRDEFLSIASHELKTPLTSLRLQIQMRERQLERGRLDAFTPEALTKMVRSDSRQIDRLARLVDDMLDIARIRTGKLSLQRERFDLCELLRDVTERLAENLEASSSRISLDCRGPLEGDWDRFRLEQVYVNLLTNAMKYGGRGPVLVSTSGTNSCVRLSVRDQGAGIAPEHLERIFERFERAVLDDGAGGLGLGLYISREIVEAHGGTIRADSRLGQGSEFIVELPTHS